MYVFHEKGSEWMLLLLGFGMSGWMCGMGERGEIRYQEFYIHLSTI